VRVSVSGSFPVTPLSSLGPWRDIRREPDMIMVAG